MSQTLYKHQRRDPAALRWYWRALHNRVIFLPSLPAFLLPTLLVLLLIEQLSKHVSVWRSPLSWESIFLSVCEWVYVFFSVCISLRIWFSVQFLWYHSSLRNWLSYDNTEGIIQNYCSRCFDLLCGKRPAEQMWQWGWSMNRRDPH